MAISKPFKGLATGKVRHENANQYARVFYGDQNLCEQWITYAQGILTQMLMRPGTQSRNVMATPDVSIRVTCRPNRIEINAGGGIYVTRCDVTSSDGAYPDKTLPPYQQQLDRLLYLNTDVPKVKQNYYAGDRYWYNKSLSECISWRRDTIYYKGLFYTIGETETIACACLYGNIIRAVIYESTYGTLYLTEYEWSTTGGTLSLSPSGISIDIDCTSFYTTPSMVMDNHPIFNETGDVLIFQGTTTVFPGEDTVIAKVIVDTDVFSLTGSVLFTMSPRVSNVSRTQESTVIYSGIVAVIGFVPALMFYYGGSDSGYNSESLSSVSGVGTFLTGSFMGNMYCYLYRESELTAYSLDTVDSKTCTAISSPASYDQSGSVTNDSTFSVKVSIKEGRIDLDTGINTLGTRTIFTESYVGSSSSSTYNDSIQEDNSSFVFSSSSNETQVTRELTARVLLYSPKYDLCVIDKTFTTTNAVTTATSTESDGSLVVVADAASTYEIDLITLNDTTILHSYDYTRDLSSSSSGSTAVHGGIEGVTRITTQNIAYQNGLNNAISYTKRSSENNKIALFSTNANVSTTSAEYIMSFGIIKLKNENLSSVIEFLPYQHTNYSLYQATDTLFISVTK